jgi:hypothetical protein
VRWKVTLTEEYGWVKWWLSIGVKIMVRGLATREWGEGMTEIMGCDSLGKVDRMVEGVWKSLTTIDLGAII